LGLAVVCVHHILHRLELLELPQHVGVHASSHRILHIVGLGLLGLHELALGLYVVSAVVVHVARVASHLALISHHGEHGLEVEVSRVARRALKARISSEANLIVDVAWLVDSRARLVLRYAQGVALIACIVGIEQVAEVVLSRGQNVGLGVHGGYALIRTQATVPVVEEAAAGWEVHAQVLLVCVIVVVIARHLEQVEEHVFFLLAARFG